MKDIQVYIETGQKRAIAGALEWPGWCRVGRNEAAAIQALVDYAPRYAGVLGSPGLAFKAPVDSSFLAVSERLLGNGSTDFGVPGIIPDADRKPVDPSDFKRLRTILEACWQALENASWGADGVELRKGPRGGGRELEEVVRHVLEAQWAYLDRLGWKEKRVMDADPEAFFRHMRQATVDGLEAAVNGELPEHGPRGAAYWPVRYFIRRSAWHILDHAWEIEDRSDS